MNTLKYTCQHGIQPECANNSADNGSHDHNEAEVASSFLLVRTRERYARWGTKGRRGCRLHERRTEHFHELKWPRRKHQKHIGNKLSWRTKHKISIGAYDDQRYLWTERERERELGRWVQFNTWRLRMWWELSSSGFGYAYMKNPSAYSFFFCLWDTNRKHSLIVPSLSFILSTKEKTNIQVFFYSKHIMLLTRLPFKLTLKSVIHEYSEKYI